MSARVVEKRLTSLVVISAPFVTLAITPMSNYDPINPIKVLVASTIGFSCLALLLKYWNHFEFQKLKLLTAGIMFLILGFVLSFFMSGAPWNQQLWGSFGRNNGLITNLALLSFLLSAIALKNMKSYELICLSLTLTSIPMTLYCLVQLAGLDPFPWSSFQAFGTLGNVNFLSAFLGMSSIANTLLIFDKSKNRLVRGVSGILALLGLFVIAETDSIQGILIFSAGILVASALMIGIKFRRFIIPYFLLCATIFGLTAVALFDKGPLARFIYQPTVVFRGEYMAAGLKMFRENLLFGVGIDSYGDWYSYSRGILATFRTGINRTSNSAHNVFIDVASGSGLFALIGFLIIHLVVLVSAIKYLRKSPHLDLTFMTIFCVWVAYTIQSVISINQIGIGIWGWIFAGSIIGISHGRSDLAAVSSRDEVKKKSKNVLSASDSLVAFGGLAIGFTLAFLPLKSDADYRHFANQGDLLKMMETAKRSTSSAVLVGQTQIAATKNSFFLQAREMNEFLVTRYPRDFFGWQSRVVLDQMEITEQDKARIRVRELDPFFFCFEPNSKQLIRESLFALPQSKQWELAKFWGLASGKEMPLGFSLTLLEPTSFDSKVAAFCNI
jgi:hypothetical protein